MRKSVDIAYGMKIFNLNPLQPSDLKFIRVPFDVRSHASCFHKSRETKEQQFPFLSITRDLAGDRDDSSRPPDRERFRVPSFMLQGRTNPLREKKDG